MKVSNRILATLLITVISGIFPIAASADVALIVHPSRQLDSITVDLAAAIFLGKTRVLPDETKVFPIDQKEGEASREEFHEKITGKDKFKYKAYWYRMVFTGKGQPPETVIDDEEMLELISTDESYIGYIDSDSLPEDGSVKVLLTTSGGGLKDAMRRLLNDEWFLFSFLNKENNEEPI